MNLERFVELLLVYKSHHDPNIGHSSLAARPRYFEKRGIIEEYNFVLPLKFHFQNLVLKVSKYSFDFKVSKISKVVKVSNFLKFQKIQKFK